MSAAFLLTSLVVVASPGTGVLYTLAAGVSRGRRASVVAAFGCTLGILPHIAAAILGLAFGVLVDAFLVRMTLVPAVLQLLGDRAWRFPRVLDRLLPNVDIEGDSLKSHLDRRVYGRRGSNASAVTTFRDAGAGWSCVEYGRLRRCPRWTSVVEPPPSRLIALSAPSRTITCASSSIDSPPSTFERRPSQATAVTHCSETPSAARG